MTEHDPYQPPESPLEPKPNPSGNMLSWKVFFWIIAVLMGLSVIGVLVMPNLQLWDYADLILTIVATAGLYGYAYSKPIGSVVFWRYFFYVVLLETIVVSLIFPLLDIPLYGEIAKLDTWYLIGWAIGIAFLIALYRYAYKTPFIWQSKH